MPNADAAIRAVLNLHRPEYHNAGVCHTGNCCDHGFSFTVCSHCTDTGDACCVVSNEWPCPTVDAIRAGGWEEKKESESESDLDSDSSSGSTVDVDQDCADQQVCPHSVADHVRLGITD